VEFAVTVPILFLVLFTSFEFSRMNVIRQTAVNAAYEGARRGIVPGASETDVENVTQGILNVVGTRAANIAVDPTVITPDTTEVTVTVTVPMEQNGWIASRFFAGRTVETSCTLKRELIETVVVP
jgi:Flp pilus assembly protein TadG